MVLRKFDSIKELAASISKDFISIREFDYDNDLAVIVKYEEAASILSEIIHFGYNVATIELEQPDINNYDDEFIISIHDYCVWCEPFKRNGKYFDDESAVTYVSGNCNSRCLKHISDKNVIEFNIYDKNNEDGWREVADPQDDIVQNDTTLSISQDVVNRCDNVYVYSINDIGSDGYYCWSVSSDKPIEHSKKQNLYEISLG